jgi:hypothetical protein
MMKRQFIERIPLLASLLAIILFYSYFFGDAFLSPNSYMHTSDHDGIKNYFTFSYHTANEGVSTDFKGMNYPYGENIVYTDSQPIVGFLIGWLPFLKGYEVGLLNLLMYFSVLLTALILWKIFKDLSIHNWIAAAGIFAIIILSPQFIRFKAHYALSYMWVIPFTILLLLRFVQCDRKLKYSLYFFLFLTVLFFIHPYLGLMALIFAGITFGLFFVFRKIQFKQAVIAIGFIGGSALFFKLFLLLTDTHLGRTIQPSGLFENNAFLETIFVPYISPFKGFLSTIFPILHGQPYEGWGYIGFATILGLTALLIFWLKNVFFKRKKAIDILLHPVAIILLASIFVLLFSMLIPMKWFQEETIYKLGFLNQFRSIGRFSWVFYYTAGIVVVLGLNYLMKRVQAKWRILIWSLVIILPVLNGIEAFGLFKFFSPQIAKEKNLFKMEHVDADFRHLISVAKAQDIDAILPIPYYHVGSEHCYRVGTKKSQQLSMVLSYHTGIPLMSSFLSRTSISESMAQIGLLTPNYYQKKAIPELKGKTILIYYSKEAIDHYESNLIARAKLIYENENAALYKINYDELVKLDQSEVKNNIKEIEKDQLEINGLFVSDTSSFYCNNFEDLKSPHVYGGKGGLILEKSKFSFLTSLNSTKEEDMVLRFWYYKGNDGLYNAMVFVEETDTILKKSEWLGLNDAPTFPIIDQDWVLIEIPFHVKEGPYNYKAVIKGADKAKGYFYVDNVVLSPANLNYYTKNPSWIKRGNLLYNNIPIR